jgi:hypothetical protein
MKKKYIIKCCLFSLILSILMTNTYAQTGINFQGVARTSNNIILSSQAITIKLSILKSSTTGTAEYTEIRKVTTNAQGLFTAVIGDTGAISTLGNFTTINWKLSPKFLKIEMDPAAGANFITIGTTQFQYVAYAQFAKSVDAENIVGILPVSNGGTGLSTIAELKSALVLDKINNTADADKPISTKTQAALDLISITATDTTRFLKRINSKADTADVSIITTTLETKLNAADTIRFTKKSFSDSSLLTKLKIADTATMLSSRIAKDTLSLSNRINLKANTTDLTLGLELKENILNKSTANDLGGVSPSDVLFPTQKAVKDYVTANAGSGGVADGGITNIKLADKSVSFSKFQNIPTNTILGNTTSSTTNLQAIATTGSENVVLSNSPTITSPILISPNIGIATADSINSVAINGVNFKGQSPSITVKGTTTFEGSNTGDNVTNTKYEGLLTNPAVDLINDQAIDGKKTFLNDITMANLIGVGSITPTTINFANGSRIGDIQNLLGENPDAVGSIDLYSPDGAKWVQMNYANTNYIWVNESSAGIDIFDKYWKFNGDGNTELPLNLSVIGNIVIGKGHIDNPGESLFDTARIVSPTNMQITVLEGDFIPGISNSYNWNFKSNGNTELPGDLNLTDNHAINFTSTGTSTPTTNASITSAGPLFKIQTRKITNSEYDEDVDYGVELNYAGRTYLQLRKDLFFLSTDDDNSNENYWSSINFNFDNFDFLINNNASQYRWSFYNDGSTVLPGTLKIGNTLFPNVSGNPADVLTINGDGNAVWQVPASNLGQPLEINQGSSNYGFMLNAPSSNTWGSTIGFQSNIGSGTITKTGLFQLDGDGAMVFRNYQNQMYFDNFDENGVIQFRIGGEYVTKKGMTLNNLGNLYVDGMVSSAGVALTSDIRLKKNISHLENSLSIIQKLNPVSYNKKKSIYGDDYSIKENGFIAQELQKILPDLVHVSEDKDKLLSVNYTAIIPILTKGIQEQQSIIEDQKKRLEALEKLVYDLIQKK